MSSTPFGEHLKREREMRGVSLEEVSAATRISTRFLEAMEKDQWERLPGGVFNRGFIRSIARYLGLDEDGLVAEYSLDRQSNGNSQTAVQQPADMPRNWRPLAVAIGVIVLLIAGLSFAYVRYGAAIKARLHGHAPVINSQPAASPQQQANPPSGNVTPPTGEPH